MNLLENNALSDRAFIVDASALLAWAQDENGGAVVEDLIDRLVISTVNWIEVAQKALSQDVSVPLLRSRLERRGLLFRVFRLLDTVQVNLTSVRNNHYPISTDST